MPNRRFWDNVRIYCTELAPVAGPLFSSVADLARALDIAALPEAGATPRSVAPVPSELD